MTEQGIDKRLVARAFSQAAASYDSVAQLQRDVGTELMTMLPVTDREGCWLDLGAGTGYFTERLGEAIAARSSSRLIALDLAHGMLQFARSRLQQSECVQPELSWVCGDAENLPLADDLVELTFSSLALQWCHQTEQLFAELYRVTKPGGYCCIATLGPRTLDELRCAWRKVDDRVHVNQFTPFAELREVIEPRWQVVEWQSRDQILRYAELMPLMRELKALGAHNVNDGRPQGLSGRQTLAQLAQGYEPYRLADGMLPATYELLFMVLRKPA